MGCACLKPVGEGIESRASESHDWVTSSESRESESSSAPSPLRLTSAKTHSQTYVVAREREMTLSRHRASFVNRLASMKVDLKAKSKAKTKEWKEKAATEVWKQIVAVASVRTKLMSQFDEMSWDGLERKMPMEVTLRPSSELADKLFNWPDSDFDKENCVRGQYGFEPWKFLKAGDMAIDFSVLNAAGTCVVNLKELLKTKPVFLNFAMTTCPHFRGSLLTMQDLPKNPQFGDRFHWVAINSIQPHPVRPDPCYDTGKPWVTPFSDMAQPLTYERRREDAVEVRGMLGDAWTVVVDDMGDFKQDADEASGQVAYETSRMNPLWSTYGPAPRATYVVHQCGAIVFSQLWFAQKSCRKSLKYWANHLEETE